MFPKKAKITSPDQKPQYFYSKENDTRYFCPDNENMLTTEDPNKIIEQQKYCVFEKKFKKNEEKKCNNEAKPLIVENTNWLMMAQILSAYDSRRLYDFVYKVSESVQRK